MDPELRPRQMYQQRLSDALPQHVTEFNRSPPTCFIDFADDDDVSDERIRRLYEQADRRRTLSGTHGILVSHFLLG